MATHQDDTRTIADSYPEAADLYQAALRAEREGCPAALVSAVQDLADACREEIDGTGELRRGQLSSERLTRCEQAVRATGGADAADEAMAVPVEMCATERAELCACGRGAITALGVCGECSAALHRVATGDPSWGPRARNGR